MEIIWQQAHDRAGYQHAYLAGEPGSVCKAKAFHPSTATVPEPSSGLACPRCAELLPALLSHEEKLDLPLVMFNQLMGSKRALRAILLLREEAKSLRDIEGLTVEDFSELPSIGKGTLKIIENVYAKAGVPLPHRSKTHNTTSWRVLTEEQKAEKRRMLHEGQVKRFVDAVGVDGLKNMTLEAIGQRLGISRERTRQLFKENPILCLIRGGSRQDRMKIKLAVFAGEVMEGKDLLTAAKSAGVHPVTVERIAENDPAVASLVSKGKAATKTARANKVRVRFKKVVDYAKEHQLKLKGACCALGLSYQSFAKTKNMIRPELKEDPEFREILNPSAVIQEAVAIARDRILDQGMSFTQACQDLEPSLMTLRRHLAKDPVVESAIQRRAKKRTTGEELEVALAKAKALILGGASVSRASILAGIHRQTIHRYLSNDSEVAHLVSPLNRGEPLD